MRLKSPAWIPGRRRKSIGDSFNLIVDNATKRLGFFGSLKLNAGGQGVVPFSIRFDEVDSNRVHAVVVHLLYDIVKLFDLNVDFAHRIHPPSTAYILPRAAGGGQAPPGGSGA